MRRVFGILGVLVIALSIAIWLKVRETKAALDAPAGGSGVIEGTSVQIMARIPSRIEKIHADEGDRVEAGQLLVELDCAEPLAAREAALAKLAAAEGQAEAAKAQVDAALGSSRAAQAAKAAAEAQSAALEASRGAASRQAERLTRLKHEGSITDVDLDRTNSQVIELNERLRALEAQQRAAIGQADAARAQAEAVRGQARAAAAAINAARADIERTEAAVRECKLSAPRGGTIETRAFEEGEVVLPGSRILEVVELDPVETVFYLPNRELSAAAPGKAVTIRADAYPDRTFAGSIIAVAAESEFTPRNVQTRQDRDRLVYAVRVRIPNPDRVLRAGMPVEVQIEGASR
ncbi:MAG: efflux RND transporter periplasmic adaptor subunit [Deltaproteobacteria bacterium]|nr:efflux RND transporter periplasmic adaptor subunit [Deltaproteobacteria bacterium]